MPKRKQDIKIAKQKDDMQVVRFALLTIDKTYATCKTKDHIQIWMLILSKFK